MSFRLECSGAEKAQSLKFLENYKVLRSPRGYSPSAILILFLDFAIATDRDENTRVFRNKFNKL